jgi:drug/metabolite transporter (DMT)-like permease
MLRADLALAVITLIWGSTFVVVKNALDDLSTLLYLAARFSLATVAVLMFYRGRLSTAMENPWPSLRGGVLAGLCLIAGYTFQTSGLRYTTPSMSAFLTGLTTLLVPFLSSIVYKKAPHLSEGIGVVVATAGLGLLTLRGDRFDFGKGELLTLGCTVAYASHILVLGRYSHIGSLELLSVTQMATAALAASLTFWWAETPRARWTPSALAAVAVTGLLSSALAFSVQAWAQRRTTPTHTALVFALEPVFAALTSYLVIGEILPGRAMGGAMLILAGILLAELKPIGRMRHPVT